MLHANRGSALLEVMAAVAILSFAGLSVVEITAGHARALHEASLRERETTQAERILTAHVLLSRTDLNRRIGRHEVGDWIVAVQRPVPTLYRVAVSRAAAPDVEQLVSVVFRPESTRAP